MMEITLIGRLIMRRWWLLAIPLVVSVIAAIAAFLDDSGNNMGGFQAQIRYSAAQEFNLPQRDGDYQDVWLASELTVNAFTDWIRSSSFRDEMRALLGESGLNPGALGIAADNARSIGVIYLSHPDGAMLQEFAAAAIVVLSQRNQGYFPQLGGEAAQVTILEAPTVAAVPPPIADRVAPVLRIAVGVVLGFALLILAEFFDRSIHDRDDLSRLGIPVIGSIPRYSTRRSS